MSFRQPTQTNIRYFHFWGNTYDFPVESVLRSKQGDGQLHIEASSGYGLTTIIDSTPKTRQTISYVNQADGSWLAQGRLSLVATGPSLINGTVTLRDSIGETLSLMVSIEPVLFVDGSTVSFNQTEPNETDIIFLKIRQQGAITPVALAIHDSNRFALATSTQEVDFTPNLTIDTPFDGTYVYIRYVPSRSGRDVARLVITTPYDTKTVSLEGQANIVAGWYRLRDWPDLLTPWRMLSRQPAVAPVRKWALSSLLLVMGLGYASYTYRCQLAPSLCQNQNVVKTIVHSQKHTLVRGTVTIPAVATPAAATSAVATPAVATSAVATPAVNKEKLTAYSTRKTRNHKFRRVWKRKGVFTPRLVKKANTRGRLNGKGVRKRFRRVRRKRGLHTQIKPIQVN